MAELRKDYLTDDYVIIAKERAKRPDQFKSDTIKTISDNTNCPFCPENEHMIPGVLDQDKPDEWDVRAIPNKFCAVTKDGNPQIRTDNEFYTFGSAYGSHEVIIETPKHGVELHELEIDHIVKIIEMYVKRINVNLGEEGIIYPSLYKNKGIKAGASIAHSHTQLISYNHLPQTIKILSEKSDEYYQKNRMCAYCNIISRELNSERHISDDGKFFVFTPYASQYAMQFNLIPKRHLASITDLDGDEIRSLAENLKKYLTKLETLSSPSYNILFNSCYDKNNYFHFFISVAPRLTTWAGFEKQTGTIINPVSPEEAAKFYKGA
jgi:UDPglucose--hexose-1-phosphate uridylyltransferase